MTLLQERIKELAKHHGSMRVLGRVLEVDHAYLYRLSTGEKNDPGDDLLKKLKLRRVVSYEEITQSPARSKKHTPVLAKPSPPETLPLPSS